MALLLALGIVLFVAFLAKASDQLSRLSTGASLLLIMAGLVVVRWFTRPMLLRKLGENAQNELVVEDGGAPVTRTRFCTEYCEDRSVLIIFQSLV